MSSAVDPSRLRSRDSDVGYAAVAFSRQQRSNSRYLTHCCLSFEREPLTTADRYQGTADIAASLRGDIAVGYAHRTRATRSADRPSACTRLELSLPTHCESSA